MGQNGTQNDHVLPLGVGGSWGKGSISLMCRFEQQGLS